MAILENPQAKSASLLAEGQAAVLDQLVEGVILTDRDGRIIFVNQAAARIHGLSSLGVGTEHYADTYHLLTEDNRPYPPHELPLARAVLHGETVLGARWAIRRPDGSTVIATGSARPLLDAHGVQTGAVLTVHDDTARVHAEHALRDADERYRLAIHATHDVVWDRDAHSGTVVWSNLLCEEYGYARQEVSNAAAWWLERIHPDDRERVGASLAAALAGDAGRWSEAYRFRRGDGSHADVLDRGTVARDASGQAQRMIGAMVDVSERRRVERALRDESRTLETVNRIGALVASELDLERVVQIVTDAGVELTGAGMGAFFHNTRDEAGQSLMLYTLSGVEHNAFAAFPKPRATAVFRPAFEANCVIRSDDITRDPRYGHNPPYHGVPRGHLPVRSFLAVSVTSRSGESMGGLFFGHAEPGRFTERHERLLVGIAAHAAIAIDNARLYATAQREVAERRLAEERLRDLNDTLEARVEERTRERDRAWKLSRDMQLVLDPDGIVLAANQATEILGWQPHEVVGRSYREFVHADDLLDTEQALDRVADAQRPTYENRCRHQDGSYRWLSWVTANDAGQLYASGRDVTVQKQQAVALAAAEEALRQSQKMEAVGQLTGGIAHDFNNMLAVVMGSLDLLRRRLGDDPRAHHHLDGAVEGATRAALLTQRLLAFARQQPLSPQPLDANRLVANMSELLRHSIGADIRLQTTLAGGLWHTLADPNQLENVLLNLAVNARDAMPDGGCLTIETGNAPWPPARAGGNAPDGGDHVLIAVSDTGSGMPPEVLGRAFDPFFTTKEVGKGTGLGLSQVYGFVRQSGGHVKLFSEPGQGTTVKIYLPRLRDETSIATDAASHPSAAPAGRQELILVVEDEPAVRRFSTDALQELGYRVLEADGAATALQLLDGHPDIALLFTDVVMPDINGRKLADEARRRRPGLPVLFTTGYSRDAVIHQSLANHDVALLGKPFTVDELAAKVRRMLDERNAANDG